MITLLENGNIGYLGHVYDAEFQIYGDYPAEVTPDDPDYEEFIYFLLPDDAARAKELVALAKLKASQA